MRAARPSARDRGYSTAWDKARAGFLRHHPFCAMCAEEGHIVRAVVVDHIIPHRGDQRLFWDSQNWQPLCTAHHSADKQQQETRGYSSRIAASGLPVDAEHPFYAGASDEPNEDKARQRASEARQSAFSPQGGRGSKVAGRAASGPAAKSRSELVSIGGRRDG